MSRVLKWTPNAIDDLGKMNRQDARRVLERTERYARDGHGDVKKLKGSDEFRLRVGSWRVRFTFDHATNTIWVARVLPRSEAYR